MDGILLRRIQEVTALQLYGGLNGELKTTARGSIPSSPYLLRRLGNKLIGLRSCYLSSACFRRLVAFTEENDVIFSRV